MPNRHAQASLLDAGSSFFTCSLRLPLTFARLHCSATFFQSPALMLWLKCVNFELLRDGRADPRSLRCVMTP